MLQTWRREVLEGRDPGGLLAERCPERWREVVVRFGAEEGARLERRLTLVAIDRGWSDHLGLARRIRDGIHVVGLVGKDPLVEYTREVAEAFGQLRDLIDDDVVARFTALALTGRRIDWNQAGLLGPSSTWTYLVNDEPFGTNHLRGLLNRPALAAYTAVLLAPFLVLWALVLQWRKRRRSSP